MSNMTASSAPIPCDLLVRADAAVTQDAERRILTSVAVAIKDGLVIQVGDQDALEAAFEPEQRLDLSGKLLLPGLVNGHTHLPMTLLRGFADDLPLMQWLEEHVWPVEFQLTDDRLHCVSQRLFS